MAQAGAGLARAAAVSGRRICRHEGAALCPDDFWDIAGTLLGCCCVWQRRLQAEALSDEVCIVTGPSVMAVATPGPPRHLLDIVAAAIVAAAASRRGSCSLKVLDAIVSAMRCQGCMHGTKNQHWMVESFAGSSAMPLQRTFAGATAQH